MQYKFVASYQENGVLTVGFANEELDPQYYLLLQNHLDVTEENTFYIERDNQLRSIYGLMPEAVVFRDHMILQLDSKMAKAIDTDQEVHISFIATDVQFQRLRNDLVLIFAEKLNFNKRNRSSNDSL